MRLALLAVLASAALAQPNAVELFLLSAQAEKANSEKVREYTYREYKVTQEIDKDGKETPLNKTDWVNTKPEEAGEILRKTLQIEIQIPGDEFYQGRDRVIQKDERWVMR